MKSRAFKAEQLTVCTSLTYEEATVAVFYFEYLDLNHSSEDSLQYALSATRDYLELPHSLNVTLGQLASYKMKPRHRTLARALRLSWDRLMGRNPRPVH